MDALIVLRPLVPLSVGSVYATGTMKKVLNSSEKKFWAVDFEEEAAAQLERMLYGGLGAL